MPATVSDKFPTLLPVSTFIVRLDPPAGDGPRLAVKDLIDVEGVPTTAGCKGVADVAEPAAADAPVVATARAGGARIVGKVNLHELAWGGTGINPWFGTPTNPLDPERIPGGSSSGSAVAVATDEADVAYGTDTGGSVRIPSACCGTVGLKTTFGRIPVDGVHPLGPSLDTVGPMAADVARVVLGMQLLEPGFTPADDAARVVGRVRPFPSRDPAVDAAVDRALAEAELEVVDIELPGWEEAVNTTLAILMGEGYRVNERLIAERPDGVGDDIRVLFSAIGSAVDDEQLAAALEAAKVWRAEVDEALGRVQLLATPTLSTPAPRLDGDHFTIAELTLPVNLGGHPALVLPVPMDGPVPASLQLIGPHGGEEQLVATGAVVEKALA